MGNHRAIREVTENLDLKGVLQQFSVACGQYRHSDAPLVVVLGDVMVDRTFRVKGPGHWDVSKYEGITYQKESRRISLGGAATIARIMGECCQVVLVCLVPGRGELQGAFRESMEDLLDEHNSIRLSPVVDYNRRVSEITRVTTMVSDGKLHTVAKFETEPDGPISSEQINQVGTILEGIRDASACILVDFDRGMITPEVLSAVSSRWGGRRDQVVVQPYLEWSKYKDFSIHTLVSRDELLKRAVQGEFGADSPYHGIPASDKFFMAFPKCQNLLATNYSGNNTLAILRSSHNLREAERIEHLPTTPAKRKFQTRSIATAHYVMSLLCGLSPKDASLVASWALEVGSGMDLHELPRTADLLRGPPSFSGLAENGHALQVEKGVVHRLIKNECKIRVKNAATRFEGFLTTDEKLRRDLDDLWKMLQRENRPNKNVRAALLSGDPGAGKSYLVEEVIPKIKIKGARKPVIKRVRCQQYGKKGGGRRTEAMLREIAKDASMLDIVYLDEVDKFHGDIAESQDCLLPFLNLSDIGGSFVKAAVIATESSNRVIRKDQPHEGNYLTSDFADRFPLKIKFPSLDQRPEDIPYLVARFFSTGGIRSISAAAIQSIAEYRHKSFRPFLDDLEDIKSRVGTSDAVLLKHLPEKFARIPEGDGILLEFVCD